MDIKTVCKDKQPNHEKKIKMVCEEPLDDKICSILGSSGYFDVKDKENKQIHIFMEKGDMITLPIRICHRFTLEKKKKTT